MKWLRQFRDKWDNWVGDREMENAIRSHLSQNGYYGSSAKFQAVRLIAVQRPGWLQVYRFEVTARVIPSVSEDETEPEPEYRQLFGLAREDARHNQTSVRVFESQSERKELFDRWSDGLICLRGAKGLTQNQRG